MFLNYMDFIIDFLIARSLSHTNLNTGVLSRPHYNLYDDMDIKSFRLMYFALGRCSSNFNCVIFELGYGLG